MGDVWGGEVRVGRYDDDQMIEIDSRAGVDRRGILAGFYECDDFFKKTLLLCYSLISITP